MRNLKRALSLTLASVMLLGMMVVGAGAASYPDVDEKDNIEAIEVLQAVKVMVGDEKGNFGPDQPVNRAQMAVVMALLLDLDYDYYEGTNPFKDVPAWAAPYVAACYANGIVSGYDAYTYGSGDPVTAVQAASMMMRALGYFKYPSDYSNNGGFELATVKQASKIDLFRQINANAKDPLTRNQVAQLALNALKTPIVEADDKTISWVDGNGNVIASGGQVNYVVTASSQAYARAIDDAESKGNALNGVSGYIIELGEKLYNGDLKLNNNATDPFGRPSRYWEFDGKEIGTYAKKEMLKEEYTVEVTGKALYDLIGKATIDDTKNWDFNLYVDGVSLDDSKAEAMLSNAKNSNAFNAYFTRDALANNNKAGIGATGKGVLTQVFVDSTEKEVSIVVINTYLAKAQSDYKEKTDEVSLNVYKIANMNTTTDPVYVKFNTGSDIDVEDREVLKVLGEDFTLAKDAKENDLFLVTVAEGEIQTIADAEILSEVTLNAFKRGSWVESDNEQYDYASTAEYDVEVLDRYTSIDGKENLKDRKYNVILDKNGYMVGLELVEDVKNYVFVAGIDADKSNLKNQTAEANLIFMDGTRETAKVDMDKSKGAPVVVKDGNGKTSYDTGRGLLDNRVEKDGDFALLNTWCTYTVNANGVYTLTEVADAIDDGKGTDAGTKIKTAQYHNNVDGAKINTKNTALAGAAAGSSYAKVYGNDNSVYLTAKLDYVRFDGTNYAAVISSADNVVTNIDKADITTEDSATVLKKDKFVKVGAKVAAGGVYTLYNDKGYVIAAMVVGKDSGATSNLVYVHTDDVERERYNPKTGRATTDGDWTWVRKVIFEGEEVELTETGDNLQYISATAMEKGRWYKVTFNANNEVISSADVFYDRADMKVGPGADSKKDPEAAEAIYRAADINLSINEYDTVVFQREYVGTDKELSTYTVRPSLTGNTLYVETLRDTGVRVAEDVKTVLVQTKANKEETTYYTTSTQLKNIIDDLNTEEGKTHDFEMNLVILKGAVRYVVIRDYIKSGYKPETPNTDDVNGDLIVTLSGTEAKVAWTGKAPTDDEAVAAIMAYLKTKGYNVKSVALVPAGSGGPAQAQYEFVVTKTVGGMEVSQPNIIWKAGAAGLVEEIVVKVNGTDTRIAKTVNTTSALAAAAKVTEAGKYVYAKLGDADADYIAVDNTTRTIAKGDSFEFGFYKVTSSVANLAGATNNGGASDVKSPVSTGNANVKFVKAEEQTFDFVLELTAATTGIVEVSVGTVGTVTAGNTMASGMKVGEKHNVTVTVTADEIKGAATDITLTLALADRTNKTVKVNGKTYELTKDDTFAVLAGKVGIVTGKTGTYVKDVTAGSYDDYTGAATLLDDGHEYEFGYYQLKVTTDFAATNMAQTSAKWTLDGVAVAAPTTAFYAKEGQKLVCTVTTNATGFTAGSTSQKLTGSTGAVSAIEKAYATGTAPTGEGTNELTYTAGNEYKDGVVSFTWTTGTANNDSITIVPAAAS